MLKHLLVSQTQSKITNVQEGDYTPNAVDLRLAKVLRIKNGPFVISEDTKHHRGSENIEPTADGWWILEPGSYEIVMDNIVTVAPGEAGVVITRSTLNRNGVFITSGLYDSGYEGVMAGCMHVTTGTVQIKKGTRVGQYLIMDAHTASLYNGSYGINKQHDKKYEV